MHCNAMQKHKTRMNAMQCKKYYIVNNGTNGSSMPQHAATSQNFLGDRWCLIVMRMHMACLVDPPPPPATRTQPKGAHHGAMAEKPQQDRQVPRENRVWVKSNPRGLENGITLLRRTPAQPARVCRGTPATHAVQTASPWQELPRDKGRLGASHGFSFLTKLQEYGKGSREQVMALLPICRH